ncbi:MAG TPA: hypothetical protein VFS01_14445 [Rhizomicrobium sp.]|nr:hypothetical protein [Rhizomicrobium sp.]
MKITLQGWSFLGMASLVVWAFGAFFILLHLGSLPADWHIWPRTGNIPQIATSRIFQAPNGHAYQYVSSPNISWTQARAQAARRSWHGKEGYLATIGDEREFNFILERVFSRSYTDTTWLGGRQTAPGEWRWVTGPEGKADGGKGLLFWVGDEQGHAVGGQFANWMTSAFQHGGRWDVAAVCCVTLFSYGMPQLSTARGRGEPDEGASGYLVEYGG